MIKDRSASWLCLTAYTAVFALTALLLGFFANAARAALPVQVDHYVMQDNCSGANWDGHPSPQEWERLVIYLKNTGTTTLYGVKGTLSTQDAYVSVDPVHQIATFGDITPGDIVPCGNTDLVFVVQPACPTGHEVTFTLDVKDSSNNSQTLTIQVVITAWLKTSSVAVSPRVGNPGVTVTITAPFVNKKEGIAGDNGGISAVEASVKKSDGTPVAVLPLYDDGAHNDGASNDGTFGNNWVTPESASDYDLEISITDSLGYKATRTNLLGFTTIPFTKTSDILLVMDIDSNPNLYEPYYTEALAANGYTAFVWRHWYRGFVDSDTLNQYRGGVVIWAIPYLYSPEGLCQPSIQNILKSYLEGGGSLFICGQDIGYYLVDAGNGPEFYQNYLHATYVQDAVGLYAVIGVAGDLITDGLTNVPISGGDGASNAHWSSEIDPIQPAVTIFTYDPTATTPKMFIIPSVSPKMSGAAKGLPTRAIVSSGTAALRVDNGIYKVVYFAFPFEAIGTASYRNLIMDRVIKWLLRLTNPGSISGKVTKAADGNPIQNAKVEVLRNSIVIGSATTGSDGTYTIKNLLKGTYEVRASAAGYFSRAIQDVVVNEGEDTGNINFALEPLPPPGSISGKVTKAADGTAIEGATVEALQDSLVKGSATTVTDGAYTIPDLPIGSYDVKASATGYIPQTTQGVVVNSGQDTGNIDFALQPALPPGSISGKVTKADDGIAIQGATVDALQDSTVKGSVITSSDGTYTIDELPAGTYEVRASAVGYIPQTTIGVVVNSGENTPNIDFALAKATGSISGKVTNAADASPVANAAVQALQDSVVTGSATTGTSGTYKIENLVPGIYDVRASANSYISRLKTNIIVIANLNTTNVDLEIISMPDFAHQPGISMITLPVIFNKPGIVDVFGAATTVKLAWWDPAAMDYKYSSAPVTDLGFPPIGPCTGLWEKITDVAEIVQPGTPVDQGMSAKKSLSPGWNLFGSPFLLPVNWVVEGLGDNVIKVQKGTETKTLKQAQAAGWLVDYAWAWRQSTDNPNKGEYLLVYDPNQLNIPGMSTALQPWQGYYLKASQACELILPVPNKITGTQKIIKKTNENSWQVRLIAEAGAAADSFNIFGVAPNPEFADLLIESPPRALGAGYVDLYFIAPTSASQLTYRKAIDLRPASANKMTWRLVVETDIPNTEVVLSWSSLQSVPKSLSLILVDEQIGTRKYMRTTSGYVFKSMANGAKRTFRIEVGRDIISPLKITNIIAMPDKSTGGLAISYSLSKAAACDIKIYNLTGKLIRTLCLKEPKQAGLNNTYWDAKTTTGLPVPNGVYTCQIMAITEEGQAVQAFRPLIVIK